MSSSDFPAAVPHGSIQQVLPDIYLIKGEVFFSVLGFFKASFSRNMVILKQGDDLILVNTVRLGDDGLKELDQMGTVKHIVRLAGFHGMDDPFYKDRYPDATVWAVEDTSYFKGLSYSRDDCYFTPDKFMNTTTELPVENAKLLILEGDKPPKDGVLVLENKDGKKILIVGDSLQNIDADDPFMNFLGRNMMKMMGFVKPYNVGPGWASSCKVSKSVLEPLLELKFDHVIPCHGNPVMDDNAWEKYEPAIRAMK